MVTYQKLTFISHFTISETRGFHVFGPTSRPLLNLITLSKSPSYTKKNMYITQ